MTDPIHTELEQLVWRDAANTLAQRNGTADPVIAKADAALAEQQGNEAQVSLFVDSHIDPEHQGEDRQILHVFYDACMSEGGTADEIHLRGLRAVLARTALAKPDGLAVPESRETASVIEEPSDIEQVAQQVFEAMRFSGATSPAPPEWVSGGNSLMQDHARDVARALLARWGRQPAPHGDRGVLPMIISDTGASDEPERERIICASISGGADYVNNMPRTLTLERINSEGSTYQQYIQEPTPPAEGEVAELVEWLRENAEDERQMCESSNRASLNLERAAELLQQQHPTPVSVGEGLPGPEDCLDEGWAWFFSPRVGWRQAVFPVSTAYTHWLPAHALPLPQGEVAS